jgi:hypothetical protein
VNTLNQTADRAAMARLARVKQIQIEKRNKANEIQNVIEPTLQARARLLAPTASQIGDLVVGVESASIGPVSTHKRETAGYYLSLNLRITNLSTATVRFPGWQRAASLILLKDASQLYYNRIRFPDGSCPDGCLEEVVIEPGETIKDVLVCEVPNGNRNLELDIPYGNRGYCFTIPAGMIMKVVTESVKKPTEVTPPPPQPIFALPPEQDPNIRLAIIREYRRLSAEVERRAKNMGYDRGRQYRRTQRTKILKSLSVKYQVAEDALYSIVP